MEKGQRQSKENYIDITPTRLDLKSRIVMSASLIFSSSDYTVKEAVKFAVEIENEAEATVKKLKDENPIPRGSGRYKN